MTAYCPEHKALSKITDRAILRPLGDEAPGAATFRCVLACGDVVSCVMLEDV
jgi:hypothetical protein